MPKAYLTCARCGLGKPPSAFYFQSLEEAEVCISCRTEKRSSKNRARCKAQAAIRKGTLLVEPCQRCGSSVSIEAHHPDYAKPLEVIWLCHRCHRREHKK